MKSKQFTNELKSLSAEQLHQKSDQLRRELFMLRLTAAASHVKDNSQFKKLRRNITRILTLLAQRTQSENNAASSMRKGDDYGR